MRDERKYANPLNLLCVMSSGSRIGKVAALWGVLGVCALFVSAIFRLWPYVAELRGETLTFLQWVVLVFLVGALGVGKGLGVLHRRYAPRIVERAIQLFHAPTPVRTLLAPLFCMGFFGASPRRIITSFSVLGGILLLIFGVRRLQQPWRGMIDLAVCVGLAIGILSILSTAQKAFMKEGHVLPK